MSNMHVGFPAILILTLIVQKGTSCCCSLLAAMLGSPTKKKFLSRPKFTINVLNLHHWLPVFCVARVSSSCPGSLVIQGSIWVPWLQTWRGCPGTARRGGRGLKRRPVRAFNCTSSSRWVNSWGQHWVSAMNEPQTYKLVGSACETQLKTHLIWLFLAFSGELVYCYRRAVRPTHNMSPQFLSGGE